MLICDGDFHFFHYSSCQDLTRRKIWFTLMLGVEVCPRLYSNFWIVWIRIYRIKGYTGW